MRQDKVAALGRVTSDVTKRPHGLLAHVVVGGVQEVAEARNGATLEDEASLLGRARGNVGQRPCSLELGQRKQVSVVQERAANRSKKLRKFIGRA